MGKSFTFVNFNTRGEGTATYDSTTNTVTWYAGNLPSGCTASMIVSFNVISSGDKTINQTTTASLASVDQTDTNSANNAASYAFYVPKGTDIQLDQTYKTYTGSDGKNYVTYTITLQNNGLDNVTGLQITDKLPTGLKYVSSNPSQGTYDSSTGLWNIGNFNYGDAPLTLTITAEITATSGTIKNYASINCDNCELPKNSLMDAATGLIFIRA